MSPGMSSALDRAPGAAGGQCTIYELAASYDDMRSISVLSLPEPCISLHDPFENGVTFFHGPVGADLQAAVAADAFLIVEIKPHARVDH